ncbi:hypothetical protein H7849_21160 [Alloacidobacterium dinghuense]|uniref:YCII-related domain-containing protein n=1 Tax=Alloacidobacterium dinghuense TaxID=2763107 RepID=A0A7G8BG84_9BACT|nr:YciI family protein [Alloacidobacterium dinghuense]QNI31554.1 hypothetical protein H7849_21160 [Alloacidobacterium dinghuense]
MRFLCLYKPAQAEGIRPAQEDMEEMGKFVEEMMRSGKLVATEGCLPSVKGARVRLANGKFGVVDGPFTESKELVAGFALLQTDSKEEAIELTKRFLKVAGDGETEIRQVYEAGDLDVPCSRDQVQGAQLVEK